MIKELISINANSFNCYFKKFHSANFSGSNRLINYMNTIETKKKNKKYTGEKKERKEKKVKVNKIAKRLDTVFRLMQAKNYKLLTISFPSGTTDDLAKKLLNIWLTKLRQLYKLDYIWIAERQKNKTIHFHAVINKFISISKLDRIFKFTMRKYMKNWNTYNGHDIKKVYSKEIKSYLIKYLYKNPIGSGCSRGWSQLFTSIIIEASELKRFEAKKVFENEYVTVYKHNNEAEIQYWLSMLYELNQKLYDNYLMNNNSFCVSLHNTVYSVVM